MLDSILPDFYLHTFGDLTAFQLMNRVKSSGSVVANFVINTQNAVMIAQHTVYPAIPAAFDASLYLAAIDVSDGRIILSPAKFAIATQIYIISIFKHNAIIAHIKSMVFCLVAFSGKNAKYNGEIESRIQPSTIIKLGLA